MTDSYPSLYRPDGTLDPLRLAPDAQEVLDRCSRWLEELDRSVYLPIDLMVVLLERNNPALHRALSLATRGVDRVEDLEEQLRILARRVERERGEVPRLHSGQFSLGFSGLLQDAWNWACESGRPTLAEADLERVLRWRAELQESASVRWAIRQLASPVASALFDHDGTLRADAFDADAWTALKRSVRISARAGMPFLGTPHLIAAFCLHRGLLVQAAELANVEPRRLHDELLRIVGTRTPALPEFGLARRTLTPRLARMLGAALDSADRYSVRIREADLLEVFLDDGGSSLDLIKANGMVTPLQQLLRDARQTRRAGDGDGMAADANAVDEAQPAPSATPVLDQIGRDLSAEARNGTLPEVLGRDAELQRIINVLMRSEQRNPLLTGEAGVGKTALAVALARRIHDGTVPRRLQGMRVVEINGASLVGGTSYRGELEARIRSMLAEAERDVILFMDEAHAVFAPRTNSGQPAEVPNHFKSALASGRIAVVAATTDSEYHRWIEQDPALRRRFERIEVPELAAPITASILRSLAPSYEADYDVVIDPDAVQAAVDLSVRFMPEQSLPDKAKKVLMDAAIQASCEQALEKGPVQRNSGDVPVVRTVNRFDVARQVATKTGVPLHRVTSSFVDGLSELDARLARYTPGQTDAAREVARCLVAGRLGSVGRKRPQGVFVFAGPPGSGRSALARGLAVELFGSERALIRLAMSDFAESHSMSRLVGSPPGYVGYQDEDALVSPLRRRPSSVVLMTDFDLAHPRVQERVVRLFEEGEIADTRGLRADASHAIFVLTVATDLQERAGIGFGGSAQAASSRNALKGLRPELHDCLKGYAFDFIPFRGPSDGSLGRVLMGERLRSFQRDAESEFGVRLVVPAAFEQQLLTRAHALTDIRDIERLFHECVVQPVSLAMLAGRRGRIVLGDEEAVDLVPLLEAEPEIIGGVSTGDFPAIPVPSGSG
jgi:ATP-dependent Clp protease ATP-binding subunit ClpC